jgi:hypothetical protein
MTDLTQEVQLCRLTGNQGFQRHHPIFMKCHIFTLLSVLQIWAFAAPPAPLAIPEILKSAQASVSGTKLSLNSPSPLTAEQWTAVEELVAAGKIRSFVFSGKAGDDTALERLVKMDPEAILFFHGVFTETGAARFSQMKSLKQLVTSHAGPPTAQAAAALADHPTLESFGSDGLST